MGASEAGAGWRAATAQDLPILRRAQAETFSLAHGRNPTPEEAAGMERAARAALDDPAQMLEAALRGGAVCGYYWLRGLEGGEAFLVDLHVLPAHRRAGLGALCLARALERAREAGAEAVRLSVARRNAPALALYRARGARTLGASEEGFLLALPTAQRP